jgi:hypothetical protein
MVSLEKLLLGKYILNSVLLVAACVFIGGIAKRSQFFSKKSCGTQKTEKNGWDFLQASKCLAFFNQFEFFIDLLTFSHTAVCT